MANADVMEPAASKPPVSKSSDTVTIGCKLPNGLVLQNCAMEEYREPVMGGGQIVSTRARRLPETYTLNGNALDIAKIATQGVPHLIVGGYGITSGIPKDFWERWLEQNKHSDIVQNRIVFAESDDIRARAVATENEKIRSGLEPVDPSAPGRFSPEVRGIQVGTTSAA